MSGRGRQDITAEAEKRGIFRQELKKAFDSRYGWSTGAGKAPAISTAGERMARFTRRERQLGLARLIYLSYSANRSAHNALAMLMEVFTCQII